MAEIEVRNYDTQASGQITGKELRAITGDEVEAFNTDYNRLVDAEITVRVKNILESARQTAFEMTRHVMQRANQSYGGALAEGNQIGIRQIRPDDLDMGVNVATGTADSWQFTWTATGAQDLYGNTANPIDLGDTSTAESMIVLAYSTNHPSPKTESVQWTKFGRDLFVQPMTWDEIGDTRGGVKVAEANPWFILFPGEKAEADVNVFATGADVVRAIGVWITIGDNLRTM